MATMNNAERGRVLLRDWEQSKPDNFFTADTNLQHVLHYYLGVAYDGIAAELEALGASAATTLNHMARVEDEIGNHPVLSRWDGIGQRTEGIQFHPNHHIAGKIIWGSRIMAMQGDPGNAVRQQALFYLLNHNGEGGHMCALACTSGLIRALQTVGEAPVRDRFLPPLLDPDYQTMNQGAQFLTEVQGGSDVGTNAVVAVDRGDGTWRISGEKWFCSNINAEQFLMTARVDGPLGDGTRGLGLFLVPRTLPDGAVNGFTLRRLKDKLGTRTLASAEVDFADAVAYPIGPVENGFKNMVNLVLNTSRLMNAVACAGIMRRAMIEAASYACHRAAFGNPIATYPLVQEAVADIMSETYAATSTGFYLAHLLDLIESGTASDDDNATYRLLVNANKYITSIRGSETLHRAIEVLGGNGAIESFSVLPRLYRDMMVLESWEGSHNVLCLQVLRDISRYGIHEPFFRALQKILEPVKHAQLNTSAAITRRAIHDAAALLARLQQGGEHFAQAHSRRFVDVAGVIAQAALMLAEAQWELDHGLETAKPDVITHFVNQRLVGDYDPLADGDYLPRLERLMKAAAG